MRLSKDGFTLIELLVATTISVLVMGFSVAGYRYFTDKKVVDLAGDELRSQLTTIKNMAVVGERPAGCQSLIKYNLQFVNKQLKYQAICDHNSGSKITLPNEFFSRVATISCNDCDFSFKSLSGELIDATEVNFDLSEGVICKRIKISSGNISVQNNCL